MPYQRKNKDLITISPTVDRVLYTAVLAQGYPINEVINMAFSALLDIETESMVRNENIRTARDRLASEIYQPMIEAAKARQEEKKRLAAEAAAKKELHDKILNIVIENFRPSTPEKIRTLEYEYKENRWDSASIDYLRRMVEIYFKETEYDVDINQALELIKEAIDCKWTMKKDQ